MEVHKVLQGITLDKIRSLKNMTPAQIQEETILMQAKTTDKLFIETGVEHEELKFHISELGLEKDEDFIAMVKSYSEDVMRVQKEL